MPLAGLKNPFQLSAVNPVFNGIINMLVIIGAYLFIGWVFELIHTFRHDQITCQRT